MIQTDICIIGAGPVGLFAVFEAGLLKMRCHLVDVLPQIGGQLSEIYPKKPIYDIPGYPEIKAGELVANLAKQIEPFKPGFTLGEKVSSVVKKGDGSFEVTTSDETIISCKVIVIAAGLGCFEPRKPEIPISKPNQTLLKIRRSAAMPKFQVLRFMRGRRSPGSTDHDAPDGATPRRTKVFLLGA